MTPPEEILQQALQVVHRGAEDLALLEDLPVPIYVTDSKGFVTYFNSLCVAFSGRTPVAGQDRWCVTWRLRSNEGELLPHDQCPMAVAIREKRAIRGATAVAERPDGSRIDFMPFPTPLLNDKGDLVGALNMLIDITDARRAVFLRAEADKCLGVASRITDEYAANELRVMAAAYERQAAALEAKAGEIPGAGHDAGN